MTSITNEYIMIEDKPVKNIPMAPCVVCGENAFCVKDMKNGCDIYRCSQCRLEFCRPMPSRRQLDEFYIDYADPCALPLVVEANAKRNIEALKRYGLSNQSRLLDYGSGQGAFCQAGKSDRWFNFDPYTKDSREELLKPEEYDWITLWGVLEHVPDPTELWARLVRLLRLKGYLALTTVSTELSIPYQYKPPEHVTYWTQRAMEEMCHRHHIILREYRPYKMIQNCDVYLDAVLRTVPESLRSMISHKMPDMIEVPTNEVFVVAERTS